RLLHTLHFALNPRGRLLLGSAETVEEGSLLFEPLDKRHRLYRQVPAARSLAPAPHNLLAAVDEQFAVDQASRGSQERSVARIPSSLLPSLQTHAALPGISWREVHLQLIEH